MGLLRRLLRYRASSTIALVCLLTFALQVANDPLDTLLGRVTIFEAQYGFVPFLLADEPWRAVTGVFLHIAPWHLLNNVAFVLLLGSWLEKDIGPIRLALVFAAGALAGDAIQLLGDPDTLGLGASAGLMAIAAAALVMERDAQFARERRWLAAISLASTLGLGLVAPAISAISAHAAGAFAGVVLALAMPKPISVRTRNASHDAAARKAWSEARARIVAVAPGDARLELRPTGSLIVATLTLVVLVILMGASTIVQAGLIQDSTSATVAVIVGVWTLLAAGIVGLRLRRTAVQFDLNGFNSRRLKKPVGWSEIETLYPGRIYSGLAELGGIGFVPREGKPFGIRSLGHPPRPLAARLESIRLAAGESST